MGILKILIIMLIPMSILLGEQTYVKVTKTNNTKNFSSINDVLKEYKLNMKIVKVYNADKSISNIIYTGPFPSYERAAHYQQKLKNHFSNPQVVILDKIKKEDGIYFGLGVGYASANSPYTQINQTIQLREPANSGVAFRGELGYIFKNGIFTSLGYGTLNTNDLLFENLYASLGYRLYNKGDFVPYGSVLVGGGNLTWNRNPIKEEDSSTTQNRSTSAFIGSRIGILYNKFESFSIGISYQLLVFDHTANFTLNTTEKSTYQHSALNTFLLEFQHKF